MSSSKRASYDLEIFRKTATWAEQIVSKDKEYMDYAGAPLEIGYKMAILDTSLKFLIADPKLRLVVKLYRAHLVQQKKAYFSGVLANQITMLAFLKGGHLEGIDSILRKGPGTIRLPRPRPASSESS